MWNVAITIGHANHASVGGFIFTCQGELVLLCHLFGCGLCGIVQFVVAIFVGNGIVANLCSQPVAERLYYREDDASRLCKDGVALDEVELTVGICLSVVIQTV